MLSLKRLDRYLSVTALLVAIVALFVSWWQLTVTKEHNRLSVRPKIVVTPYLEGDGGRNGVYVSNPGLGPAIIKSMKVTIGQSTFEGVGANLWPQILKTLDINSLCFAKGWPNNDAVVKSGEELLLLGTTKADVKLCSLEALKLLNKREMTITVTYESMYGERFQFEGPTQLNNSELSRLSQMFEKG